MSRVKHLKNLSDSFFGEQSDIVLDFMEKEAPEKKTFLSEKFFLEYLVRILDKRVTYTHPDSKKWPIYWPTVQADLSYNLGIEAQAVNVKDDIIFLIRLLNGELNQKTKKKPYDFYSDEKIPENDLERFFEMAAKRRGEWY